MNRHDAEHLNRWHDDGTYLERLWAALTREPLPPIPRPRAEAEVTATDEPRVSRSTR